MADRCASTALVSRSDTKLFETFDYRASDGREWVYAEALFESHYPAVRVNREGAILADDLATARSYWRVYARALKAIEEGREQASAFRRTRP
jgi:hypothetical protein